MEDDHDHWGKTEIGEDGGEVTLVGCMGFVALLCLLPVIVVAIVAAWEYFHSWR